MLASSGESDVFLCEQSRDTPALESETVSVLPDAEVRHKRTQHGRAAVGLEPSIIHNEWEKGIVSCFRALFEFALVVLGFSGSWFDIFLFLFGCPLLGFRWLYNYILLALCSWIGDCPSWISHGDVFRTVCNARSMCCAERTERKFSFLFYRLFVGLFFCSSCDCCFVIWLCSLVGSFVCWVLFACSLKIVVFRIPGVVAVAESKSN